MATCIHSLAVSGSRLPDGAVNAGGRAFLYRPGSANQRVTPWADQDKLSSITLDSGGVLLDSAGKAAIFVDEPCVVRIEDQFGAQVDSFSVQPTVSAGLVEVVSPGFTGINDRTGQYEAGRRTFLSAALGSIAASCGGTDGNFRGVYGTTDVPMRTEIEATHLTPYRFGGKGDGVSDDTNAFVAMLAAQDASSIPIFVPKGIWTLSSSISSTVSGSIITGCGASSRLRFTNAADSIALEFNGTGNLIENVNVEILVVTATLIGISIAGGSSLRNVVCSGFKTGINCSGASSMMIGGSVTAITTATVGTWKLVAVATTGALSGGTTQAVFA